jgi:hypothetical protein
MLSLLAWSTPRWCVRNSAVGLPPSGAFLRTIARSITKAGKRQMKEDKSQWERLAAVMGRVPAAAAEGGKG